MWWAGSEDSSIRKEMLVLLERTTPDSGPCIVCTVPGEEDPNAEAHHPAGEQPRPWKKSPGD
jgi:hypothetical protein